MYPTTNRLAMALVAIAVAAFGGPAFASPQPNVQELDRGLDRWVQSLGGGATSHSDTAWFGGSGTGDGSVVRGGIWNWEAESNAPPEFFRDGDPVGNRYLDGWTFDDRTSRVGPSATGAPHFNSAGVYAFDYDATHDGGPRPGGFAHRATTHANNGNNDGPNPLAGSWTLWIGTNLFLNPEHCGWGRTWGYGDGWSQGIRKSFSVPAGSQGAQYDISFLHRYACESGYDTCWVEISFDGLFWDQVGSTGDPNGIFNPRFAGPVGPQTNVVRLVTWPTNAAGTLHVRFRFQSDAFLSDQGDGGTFGYCWQLDDLKLLRTVGTQTTTIDQTDFEAGYNGWAIASFEGYDFAITIEQNRPAGRIVPLTNLACPPLVPCPEECGLENRILMFSDRDDCDLVDDFMDSYVTSRAFAIGGPTLPDLDGDAGRLLQFDAYTDGGLGTFETGTALCFVYWPLNSGHCPFTPAGGNPGAGLTFNWSQTSTASCDFFSMGTGTDCNDNGIDNFSSGIPAGADSVLLHVGAFSQCRSEGTCDVNDNGTPFYDNLRFGVYNPQGLIVESIGLERYADNFPTANGNIVTQTARMDGAHNFGGQLIPVRSVRADTAAATCGASNAAMFLRFRVTPGPCQPNLNHPFFNAYPPNQWHAARMDSGHSQGGGGGVVPGCWMTCFHKEDPHNGTFWTGSPPANEPCDDILPDGLFTPGTAVHYFFEVRNATSGAVLGTFPRRRDLGPIGTTENFKPLWLETGVLPELTPACDGTYAHNLLVIYDYATGAVPGMGTMLRERFLSTLTSLGLDFDVYDVVGANFTSGNEGIGRREDLAGQLPRPPFNGATQLQLEPYDCIWYTSELAKAGGTLSDQQTPGHTSNDQQKLETWLGGCTAGNNRLLLLDGLGWASDIDANTVHGPVFLANRGVSVLASDYAQQLANDDLRRCARITGTALAPDLDGNLFASGCPDNYPIDVVRAVNGGEALGYFVESLEDGDDPVNCADDVPHSDWHAVVRRATGAGNCQRTAAMSFAFADFLPPNCTNQCQFEDFVINGPNAELVIDLFQWAGKPINPNVIGVGAGGAPAIEAALDAPRPNPAPAGPVIRYSISARGRVRLKIYDVGGRLVRTLVDQVQEPSAAGYEAVWDGTTDAGGRAGSGVYFYELDSPGFAASRKLVMLE